MASQLFSTGNDFLFHKDQTKIVYDPVILIEMLDADRKQDANSLGVLLTQNTSENTVRITGFDHFNPPPNSAETNPFTELASSLIKESKTVAGIFIVKKSEEFTRTERQKIAAIQLLKAAAKEKDKGTTRKTFLLVVEADAKNYKIKAAAHDVRISAMRKDSKGKIPLFFEMEPIRTEADEIWPESYDYGKLVSALKRGDGEETGREVLGMASDIDFMVKRLKKIQLLIEKTKNGEFKGDRKEKSEVYLKELNELIRSENNVCAILKDFSEKWNE